jgi:hypothetical protein
VRPAAALKTGWFVRVLISAVCALVFCVLAPGAWGDDISIQNPSFEATSPLTVPCAGPGTCLYNFGPIPGWTISGPTGGSFEPSSFYFSLPLPDGNIVAYTNDGSISQTLTGTSLLPNSIYSLSVDVGRRFDVTSADYSLSLTDGSNVFCTSGVESNGSIAAGAFQDITLTCTTGASVPAGLLGIELTGAGRQIDFDNVRLNVTSAVATPEPGVLALTLIGCLCMFFMRSRRGHLQNAS